MDERTHPVQTCRRFTFSAHLKRAQRAIQDAMVVADEPIMIKFLEPIGRADTLLDLNEALSRLNGVLDSLDALPPKVEFPGEDY